ncbi:MAG: hypothetical protein ACK5XM_03755, partial [Betaproteobacteria bacterium]
RVVNKLSCVTSAPRIAVVPRSFAPSDINAFACLRMTNPSGEFQQTVRRESASRTARSPVGAVGDVIEIGRRPGGRHAMHRARRIVTDENLAAFGHEIADGSGQRLRGAAYRDRFHSVLAGSMV